MNLPIRTIAALIIAGVAPSPVVQASKRKTVVQQAIEAFQSYASGDVILNAG